MSDQKESGYTEYLMQEIKNQADEIERLKAELSNESSLRIEETQRLREKLKKATEWGRGQQARAASHERRIEELEEEKDAALAVLRLPGLDNNGGPGDLVEEVKLWNENLNRYMRDGRLITDAQIDAAWKEATVTLHLKYQNMTLLRFLEKHFGIVRCGGCDGSGHDKKFGGGRFDLTCPTCHGEGWVIGGEDE